MSKPTHILVSIAEVEKFYTKLPFLFDTFPKVDLSEEGIKKKAKALYTFANVQNRSTQSLEQDAYLRCAKDLLNTK